MRCVVLVPDAFLLRYILPPESVESGHGSRRNIAGDRGSGRMASRRYSFCREFTIFRLSHG